MRVLNPTKDGLFMYIHTYMYVYINEYILYIVIIIYMYIHDYILYTYENILYMNIYYTYTQAYFPLLHAYI